jgi:hypothetical protein
MRTVATSAANRCGAVVTLITLHSTTTVTVAVPRRSRTDFIGDATVVECPPP